MKKAKVYIETHGCQMNVADTERAAARLRAAGYDVTHAEAEADVVLLNTCSVRERAERKVYTRVGEVRRAAEAAHRRAPVIGVTGCVAQLEGEAIFRQASNVGFVAGTRATDRLPQIIARALGGERRVIDLDERAAGEVWDVAPFERHSPYVAFVPIIEGCNKFCTYCIVPYSRGRERSRPAEEILAEILRLKEAGFKEVHLIGQNVNSYRPKPLGGLERFAGATPFARLLRAAAETGIERIKFTTSFPRDFHADIVGAIEEYDNLCNWVHLPVQSGSDSILRAMRRGYKRADYMARVEAIKRARRRIALTSDIIVGFPGETEEDFEATLRLVAECEYDGLYIFKYSKRAGTPAAQMSETVPEEVKTARFRTLESLQKRIQKRLYETYVGSVQSVLFTSESAKSPEDVSGHTTCHKVFNCRGGGELLGRVRRVRVTQAKANSLYGELLAA
jgi:tRNA-2-methylthio-N6-dimethylallyladenosine synthase